ncbi:MAG: DUF2817 domain-containing protein [Pseudomonadales bacterium]|nr:DUF2817 domain-containing protein [Pseudomonadales bacterium]
MKSFYELEKLELLIKNNPSLIKAEQLAQVPVGITELPVWGLTIGSSRPGLPVLALIGGIHGLEKVGSQAVLAFLHGLVNRLKWDKNYQTLLNEVTIISIPIVNPGGMLLHRRSNLNGVDLMRNAPQDAQENIHFPVSGHRISSHLPWYRGRQGDEMELESKALVQFCQRFTDQSPFVLSLDVHSGFGLHDRLWYPYGCYNKDFPDFDQFARMYHAFSETFPYHVYKTESQADSYGIHGDLWDFITLENQRRHAHGTPPTLIPLTLELGSWRWVKKNPIQLLGKGGMFNPVKRHRYERTMRRHYHLFDFLLHACANYTFWENDK